MAPASTERVESAIKAILVPFLGLNSGAVGTAVNVATVADQARVAITLGFPVSGIEAQRVEEVRAVVGQETGIPLLGALPLDVGPRDRKAAIPDIVVEGFS
jgi:hypothetical protein